MAPNKLFWSNKQTIPLIERALHENKIVLGTTDTVPGLMSKLSFKAFEGLNSIKERNTKPYLILIHDKEMVNLFSDSLQIEKNTLRLIEFCWPGPVTLILRAKESVEKWMASADGNIALRVPQHNGLLKLLKNFDGLFSTSANLTDSPTPCTLNDVNPKILSTVDYVIDDNDDGIDRDTKISCLPSTIIDCTKKNARIIREGACSREKLEKWYGQPFLK